MSPSPVNLGLGQPVTCTSWEDVNSINGVNVHPFCDRAYQYYVEVKTAADVPYVTVVDRSGNIQGGSTISDTCDPVLARYVYLRVESAYNYFGEWVSIS
jgi:hypothetical protein